MRLEKDPWFLVLLDCIAVLEQKGEAHLFSMQIFCYTYLYLEKSSHLICVQLNEYFQSMSAHFLMKKIVFR